MQAVAAEVNSSWNLPFSVPVLFSDQLDSIRKQFKGVRGVSVRAAYIAAVQFVLAHEIGHAMIDKLRIPVLGKEGARPTASPRTCSPTTRSSAR